MNILISGCSYSDDSGFINPQGKVWCHHIDRCHTVKNLALRGQSNYKIFTKVCSELLEKPNFYNLVIVQWTTLFRLSLNNGSSIYDNPTNFTVSDNKNQSEFYKLWTGSFIHPRVELLEFLTLISTLTIFLTSINVRYVFIKGFDNDLSNLKNINWSHCDQLFQRLVLHKDELSDWEINFYYSQLRKQYLSMVNLSQKHWLNLNTSDWFSNIVDTADDAIHAGVLTNKKFYQQVKNFVTKFDLVL
jgi:hypothetical protein